MITLEKKCHLCDGVTHTWVTENVNCVQCTGTPHGAPHAPCRLHTKNHCTSDYCY